jgi:hypothetical protein
VSFFDRFRAPVPDWAAEAMPDRRAWAEFRELITSAARELDPNSKFDEQDGVIHATLSGHTARLGLSKLVRECAQRDAREAVADWSRRMMEINDRHDADRGIGWEAAAPRLRVQIVNSRNVTPYMIAYELADAVHLVVVLDSERSTMTLNEEAVASWGQSRDALFERAIVNLLADDVAITEREGAIFAFESENDYASTVVYLGLDRIAACARHGALVVFPSKYWSAVLPIHDSISTQRMHRMLEAAREVFQAHPGGSLGIGLPPELASLLDRPN